MTVHLPTEPVPSSPGVLRLASLLLRHRLLTIALPCVLAAIVGTRILVRGRQYVAESRFTTETAGSSDARLSGLAAQLGVNLPSANQGQSLEFYVELIKSREVLDSVRAALHLDMQRKQLEHAIAVETDLKAGIITVATTMKTPRLAEALNRRLLSSMEQFNRERRQSRAVAERRFVEGRLNQARIEAARAETALQEFQAHNLRVTHAPRLEIDLARLQRDAELKENVYAALAQSYEQARIDEVRNTPVITIVEDPEGSALPAGRGLVVNVLLALFVGFVIGSAIALTREYLARVKTLYPDEYAEIEAMGWIPRFRVKRRKIHV